MDEPFSALDSMTRESLQNLILGLWRKRSFTFVLVTHSIEEAVQLSSEICIITPRPGRIDRILQVELPWPRDLEVKKSAAFAGYLGEIQEIFHGYGVI